MRIRIPGLLLTAFFLAAGSATHAGDSQLLDFELEDQFGNVHRRSDVQGTVVLLNGSDKGGVQFNGVWGKAIEGALGDHPAYDQISLLAYANLRGVPFFLKKLIRGKFPQEPERWTLMDWKGVIASAYEFAPKSTKLPQLMASYYGIKVGAAAVSGPRREPEPSSHSARPKSAAR